MYVLTLSEYIVHVNGAKSSVVYVPMSAKVGIYKLCKTAASRRRESSVWAQHRNTAAPNSLATFAR